MKKKSMIKVAQVLTIWAYFWGILFLVSTGVTEVRDAEEKFTTFAVIFFSTAVIFYLWIGFKLAIEAVISLDKLLDTENE